MEYHLFISHAWKYDTAYNTVSNWLKSAKDNGLLNYSNYSVPWHDPVDANNTSKLKKALTAQIQPAGTVIIISGMYAAYSDWMNYEIDEAVRMGKYIIGLKPWGQERIPVKIQNNANIMVGWHSQSLINAIIEQDG